MLSFVGENVSVIYNRYIQKKHHPWGGNKLTILLPPASGENVKYPSRFISAPLWHLYGFPHIYLPKIIIVP